MSELTVSVTGKEQIDSLSPFSESEALKKELDRVTELKNLLEFDDPFPLYEFADLRPYLNRVEMIGSYLQPEDFLTLLRFLQISRQIIKYFNDHPEKYTSLKELSRKLVPQHELEKSISRIIDQHAQVKDRASPVLARTRQEINRKTSRARKRLEVMLKTLNAKGYAQEDALAFREGRLVIPMKETQKGRLKGIIIDQSASGATLYMEPLETLELNNEIRRLKVQERQEIENILKNLTNQVRENFADLQESFRILGILDGYTARARFSIEIGGNAAAIAENASLEIYNGRHPLLLLKGSREKVVPLTLQLGGEIKTLIITGPNAGGKTVALKTVGLLAMMHQHGLHIPADDTTSLPLFSKIFADIGDQQSIEQDLSTFSSHIGNIKSILGMADSRGLVLMDEIGSATDPAEGAALAEVVLRHLTQKGCLSLATTHMGTLKVFAHEESGVENGSMAFDQTTLKPTYRFQMGIPGSSYAFEIAERLGLSLQMIQEARQLTGQERGKLDRLILHLEEELQRTQGLLNDAEIKESELSGLVKLYREKIDDLQKSSEDKKQKIIQKAEDLLQETNAVIERVVREIRESQAARDSIKKAKHTLTNHRKKLETLSVKKEQDEDHAFNQGDWVLWKGHKGRGEIVSKPDNSGRILVQWNEVKLRVPTHELTPTQGPEKKMPSKRMTKYSLDRHVTNEIDLRGFTADEAIEAVARYLSDAALTGLSQIGIIHGKGTGILRREVGNYLKNHPLVKSQRLGNWNEGDTGITIVELK